MIQTKKDLNKQKRVVSLISGSIAFLFLTFTFQNCSEHPVSTDQKTQLYFSDISILNEKLLDANKENIGLQGIKNLAKERQQKLLELSELAPEKVSELSLSEDIKSALPSEVQTLIEEKIKIKGEYEVLYADFDDGSHKLLQVLKDEYNKRIELRGLSNSFKFGDKVEVTGIKFSKSETTKEDVLVSQESQLLVAACCSEEVLAAQEIPPAGAHTFGEQKTLVILVNFQDKTEEPWTLNFVRDIVFNNVDSFYREASNNRTWLSGDVTGWYTVPLTSTKCDQWALATAANEAATAAGIDLTQYNRLVYAHPKSACGWTGLGTVGGLNSWAWLNGYVTSYVSAHELGHNLGLGHSGGLECDTNIIGDNCYNVGYANRLDTMGSPNNGHFNAFQKHRLGWLNLDSDIKTITSSGTYAIEPYSGNGTGTKALRVLESIDESTGQQTWYYIEFRQPIGFDSFINDSPTYVDKENILNGVIVNRGNPSTWDSSRLLDMSPEVGSVYDFNDPALIVGKTFSDINAGVTIETLSASSAVAEVKITINAQPPAEDTTLPTASFISPGSGETISGNITLAVSASDNIAVERVEFFLDGGLLGTDSADPYSYTLDTTSISNGNHTLAVQALDSSGNKSELSSITVTVDNQVLDTTLPTVSITSPSTNSTVSGMMTLHASASDNIAVSKVEFSVDGSVFSIDASAPYSASIDTTKLSEGLHKAAAQAVDSSGNRSLVSEITINVDNIADPPPVDTTAPVVTITTPAEGDVISPRTTITISATASDDVEVSRVEFYVDGSLICSDSAASYSCSYKLSGAKGASYILKAIAYDSSNNSSFHQITIMSSGTASTGGGGGGGGGKGGGKK